MSMIIVQPSHLSNRSRSILMISKVVRSSIKQTHRFWVTISSQQHNFTTFPSPQQDQNLIYLLSSCQNTCHLLQIHCSLIKSGLFHDSFKLSKLLASSSLIDIQYASSLFNSIKKPNIFMISTMLRGYSIGDCPKDAIFLFNRMRACNVLLDRFCFISVIKSCARVCDVWYGLGAHSIVVRNGFERIVNVRNGLIRFYCVCGFVDVARRVFDEFPKNLDLVSWAILMDGYLHESKPMLVVDLFIRLYRYGLGIGVTNVLSVVSAVSRLDDVLLGELLHGYCIKVSLYMHTKVVTAFIAMYADFGDVGLAKKVFDEALVKDVVAWNCLINRYGKYIDLETTLDLVKSMKASDLKPNSSTLSGLIWACVVNEALSIGQSICRYIDDEGLVVDTVLGTAIVDLYCKSGLLQKAIDVFNTMDSRDVKTWTTMISGCGINGYPKDAIAFLRNMKKENIIPNSVTFLVALNACSHGGLVNEGIECFESMVRDYNLTPRVEHYGCIIDLLGCAGLLYEAYRLMHSLPVERDETAWRSLLSACRVYGNVELAKHVKKVLNDQYGGHPSDEMVLSSTYVIAGRLPVDMGFGFIEKRNEIRREDDVVNGVKETGLSMIELDWQEDLKKINWLSCD